MKKMKYLLLMTLMILFVTACANNEIEEIVESETAEQTTEEGTKEETEEYQIFGTFTSQTLEGDEVTQDIFAEADLTMVNIWGTFCGPCIKEMPDLGEISREYEEKGFQIVGLLSDVEESGDATALSIVDQTKADYTHIVASEDLITNVLQYVSAVPTTIFVDKEGNMVGEIYTGSRDKEAWELIITQCLAQVK